jgi:hypothetical protein
LVSPKSALVPLNLHWFHRTCAGFRQPRTGFTKPALVSPNLRGFRQIRTGFAKPVLVSPNLCSFHQTRVGFTESAVVPLNLHWFHQTCTGSTEPALVPPNLHWFHQTCTGSTKPALGRLVRQSGTRGSKKMSRLKNSLSGFDHLTGLLYGGKFRYFRNSIVDAARRLNRKE